MTRRSDVEYVSVAEWTEHELAPSAGSPGALPGIHVAATAPSSAEPFEAPDEAVALPPPAD